MTANDSGDLDLPDSHNDEVNPFVHTEVAPSEIEVPEEGSVFEDPPYKAPGPGLPECFGWLILFFLFQLGAFLVVFIGLLVATVENVQELQGLNPATILNDLSPTAQLFVLASPALFGYFLLIPAGLLRMLPRPMSALNFSPPTTGQVLVAVSMVLPLTMVADFIMKTVDPIWKELVKTIPALQGLDSMDVHEMLSEFGDASLPMAIFLIAVVPAVGEEFLFRGLIGRGLVARWGLIIGIGLTSFLFAAVHMYPPHVIAILPVGLALHWVYLTTKSFWAPMLFHFVNNSIATILMRAEPSDDQTYWFIIPCAMLYFVWGMYWLYQMRTTYQTEKGEYQAPGHEVAASVGVTAWRESKTYVLPVIVAVGMIALEVWGIVGAL